MRAAGLQDRLTFDAFVEGPGNAFALAIARQTASWADGHFNPVFFCGPYGYGKTHLLNAIAWEAQRLRPNAKVIYLTAERFLSTFVRAVQDRQTAAFKESLRSADMLLIDDVQFVGGKSSTQEELLHTLTALIEDGKRVVMSGDQPPTAMTEIEPRLRSPPGRGPDLSGRTRRPHGQAGGGAASASRPWAASASSRARRVPRFWSSWWTARPVRCANWRAR